MKCLMRSPTGLDRFSAMVSADQALMLAQEQLRKLSLDEYATKLGDLRLDLARDMERDQAEVYAMASASCGQKPLSQPANRNARGKQAPPSPFGKRRSQGSQ